MDNKTTSSRCAYTRFINSISDLDHTLQSRLYTLQSDLMNLCSHLFLTLYMYMLK